MQKEGQIIDSIVVTKESVTPADFLNIARKNSSAIKNTKFIPPRIGDNSFGHFEVEYRVPKITPI